MKAIETKFLGATNTRGSRVTASDNDGNRVTLPYPHELSGEAVHRFAAEALRDKMGWTGALAGGATKTGYAFVFLSEVCRRPAAAGLVGGRDVVEVCDHGVEFPKACLRCGRGENDSLLGTKGQA